MEKSWEIYYLSPLPLLPSKLVQSCYLFRQGQGIKKWFYRVESHCTSPNFQCTKGMSFSNN